MANYSYQSSSYSSGGNGGDAAFQQADANSDGRIDLNEFRNFLGKNDCQIRCSRHVLILRSIIFIS